ncbi:hypothetical protein D4T97_013090 [Siminovitchia acidinfaciens]|uniref:YqhG family protein n=1 Tax=Siminovitchia acidinfaciens TaxID=2321395 RepID=A0A429XYI0_9BACI|nr:YqhG family protein [Siminovitchia acidinfaciens]RST73803.1 hypothetical protein D4T97_013090 [Siminovitchia acidinfaciens]
MLQKEVHQYLEQFFLATGCTIEEYGPGFLTVQLTVEMDKELMNRPFYWTYLEKTGGIPNPMKVTFITDQEKAPPNIKGEFIHFGAPRLHQLFLAARKLAAYIRLYESPHMHSTQNVPLHPWLNVNMKISYCSDRKKDVYRSFGLNLINGSLIEQFDEKISPVSLTPKIPDYCFTISPIIMPTSGLKRIEAFLTNEIHSHEHPWADAAQKRWMEDSKLLDQFYDGEEEKPETYFIEKKALEDQYKPDIQIDILNGGIFYLQSLPA